MTPEEIRDIRLALGLTQAEAGDVLGGGPRAFAKYEAGIVAPSAGIARLLRLLDANPETFSALSGRQHKPNPSLAEAPFTATGDEIMRLREWELPQFLRLLLHAEAEANGLPTDDIHVAEGYCVADGGEDAHIRWRDAPERTAQLPARYTQFQIKTGDITPSKAASEVLTKDKRLKPMVRTAIEEGAHYVLLCTRSLTAKKAAAIAKAIRSSISGTGQAITLEHIHVWDADQLAAWANCYPPVGVLLKERTRPNAIGPFRSWIQWANRAEHILSPFVDDDRLIALRNRLTEKLDQPGTVVRVVGAAGVGKSRLVLESLCETEGEGLSMRQFVLYANQSEVEETAICGAVRTLADTGARAIVVIDDCPPDTHRRLAGMAAAPRSRLSVVTIDNEESNSANTHDSSTISIEQAPKAVTESIIDRELPGLPSEDRRRLLLFSHGFPTIAVRVAQAWADNKPMPYATDDYFVNAFVTGRNDPEPTFAIKTAMLIAAFGTVRHSFDDSDVPDLAAWGRGLTTEDMHAALERLIDRGVVQRRGRLVVLQPRPVAMRLTERQWREWTNDQQLALLEGDLSERHRSNVARQLAWINDTDTANQAARLFLRPDGPLDGIDRLVRPGNADVLFQLGAVDAQLTVDSIRRTLDDIADLRTLPRSVRRALVETLEAIAFVPDTFAEAASLMLRLAVAETESGISNNATGQFAALFPMLEGATAAGANARISFLSEAANTNDALQSTVVVEALLAGAKTMHFSRVIGAETHGSRPALRAWRPATRQEASEYIKFFVECLAREAIACDEVGTAARTGLGNELRALVGFGLLDTIETVVNQVRGASADWPEAVVSLGHFLRFEGKDAPPTVQARVRRLIDTLQPTTLDERIRGFVSNMPWDYPNGEDLDHDEQVHLQRETVKKVAAEALGEAPVLVEALPQLCRGSQRWAAVFGECIAERANAPEEWLRRIAAALLQLQEGERNFDLLTGFAKGLAPRDPDAVSNFKRQIAVSSDLAPALPAICARLGIVDTDIGLAADALCAGVLPAWSLNYWAYGDVLRGLSTHSLGPLFDALLRQGAEGFRVTVDLIGMLAHGNNQRLEDLRGQLLALATCIADSSPAPQSAMGDHHVENLFKWLLSQGRHDSDACSLALTLSGAVAQENTSHETIELLSPLLPNLLSGFPEIAWASIGPQLVKHTGAAWELREELRGGRAPHREGGRPPILSLPPDTLFAWCSALPDEAPAFAAGMLPVLASDDPESSGTGLHPLFVRLLDQYGDRRDLLEAAENNICSFSWVGSLTGYFSRFLGPLATLREHRIGRVARWAKRMGLRLEREIERAQNHDDERQARFEV